jgi:hypothetical protein
VVWRSYFVQYLSLSLASRGLTDLARGQFKKVGWLSYSVQY